MAERAHFLGRRGRRFDALGLERAMSDRLLPLLVGAMAFLAALALAGAVAAASLSGRWQQGAASALTVQVPQPRAAAGTQIRLDRTLAILKASAAVASAEALDHARLVRLLRPWLGSGGKELEPLLPAVVTVQLRPGGDISALRRQLAAAVPSVLVENQGSWAGRLTMLARSLEACAEVVLAVVALVAAAVVAVAIRSGLAARRESIEIIHGLGATNSFIAGRFAARATWLTGTGGLAGAVLALPVLLWLARLATPFSATPNQGPAVPILLLLALPALPAAAAAIGFLTAQGTVRIWLRRLP